MTLNGAAEDLIKIVQLIPEVRRQQISRFKLDWERTYMDGDEIEMYPVVEIEFEKRTAE